MPTPGQQSEFIILVQGALQDGQPYWAYVKLNASAVKAFQQAYQAGQLNLRAHGEVLEWGIGDAVPQEVRARLERDERVNHTFMQQLEHKLTQIKKSRPGRPRRD